MCNRTLYKPFVGQVALKKDQTDGKLFGVQFQGLVFERRDLFVI